MFKQKIKLESLFGEKNNENIILVVGFILIFVVIIFTIFRNTLFSDTGKVQTPSDLQQSQQNIAPSFNTISANELNKKIMIPNGKEKVTLLDIRPFESYIAEHIVDSVNIPIDEFPVASKIDTHSLVVVIGADNTDKSVASAMDDLKQEDFKNTVALAGGMALWKQLIGSTVTYGDPKSFVDQSKVFYLDPPSLNDAITQKVPVCIVDVRSKDEYDKGHITGAINIPFDDLEKRRHEISEKKVVVVGANELQEFQASVQMYDMLLVSPFVMRTAMPGWQDKGFSLVK